MYDTRFSLREARIQICTRVAITNTRVQYSTCYRESRVCTRVTYRKRCIRQLTYSKVKMQVGWIMNVVHNMPIYSVLGNLQSINVLLCANIEMSTLGRRSAIWVDNRCPLMWEVRGKRWPKYIIIFIFGELRNPM